MKRILLLITLVNVLTISQAVEVVVGKVMNRTLNAPVERVLVKSSIHTVRTNALGEFRLNVAHLRDSIHLSRVGFSAKTYPVMGQTNLGVLYLLPDSPSLVLEEDSESNAPPTAVHKNSRKLTHPIGALSCVKTVVPYGNETFESYESRVENQFRQVTAHPLSTFSVDVDQASYANVRRYLNLGTLPPKNAVKVEELVNYFRYAYPVPASNEPFALYQHLGVCPWNSQHQVLQLGIQAPKIEVEALPASNFVFLIDVSGSMQAPNKLPLLKASLKLLVQALRPQDFVSIVTYAGTAGVALYPTSGGEKGKISQAIEALKAGGSTAGGAGLTLAYDLAGQHRIQGGNNRIVMATDGDFNVGPSGTQDLKALVEEKRESGIFISVLGFGMGNYKDDKMEAIAQNGNGNHAYIDNLQEAKRVLVNELGGTMHTVAKDVKIQVEFNPAEVLAYRLVGYENRLLNEEDFNNDRVDAGEIGAGHQVTALYEIIPAHGNADTHPMVDPLKYQGPKTYTGKPELATLKVRYKKPDNSVSTRLEIPIAANVRVEPDANLGFATVVAHWGMLLGESPHVQHLGYEVVLEQARQYKGNDVNGYRAEFIRLVEMTRALHTFPALNQMKEAASTQ